MELYCSLILKEIDELFSVGGSVGRSLSVTSQLNAKLKTQSAKLQRKTQNSKIKELYVLSCNFNFCALHFALKEGGRRRRPTDASMKHLSLEMTNLTPILHRGTLSGGQFNWGSCHLKGNGGAQRSAKSQWKRDWSGKGISWLDSETDRSNWCESRS